jgi:outer membrane lipoprotein
MRKILFPILPLLLFLNGCTHWISEQSRALADPTITFSQLSANPDAFRGKCVMLGGIIAAITRDGGTQLEVIQHAIDKWELPDESIHTGGRFLAATSVVLDPEKYEAGTLVTMVGEVTGRKVHVRQGQEHVYPVIAIKDIRDIVIPQESLWGYFGGP